MRENKNGVKGLVGFFCFNFLVVIDGAMVY